MNSLFDYKQDSERRIYKLIFGASISIYLIYIITAILSNRALYADGSDFFVRIVNNRNNFWPYFDDSKHIRLFANLINQFPTALALHLGVRNMEILRILFGTPLFINNLIGMIVCTWICHRGKKIWLAIFPFASYALFCIVSEIFIVNQAFLAFWLYYIAFLYLILEMKWKFYDWIIIFYVLMASYRSHEGILVYGPLIILYFIINIKKIINSNKSKVIVAVSTLLEISYAAWWQLMHPVKEQTENYLGLLKMLLDPKILFTSNMIFSIIGVILLLAVLVFGYKFNEMKNQKVYYMVAFTFLIISTILGLYHIKGIGANPFNEYNYRVFATFGGAFFMLLAIVYDKLNLKDRINVKLCFFTIAIILLVQSIWQIGNNYQWNKLESNVKQQISSSNKALLKPEEIGLKNSGLASNQYQWPWTGPVFSIALQDSLQVNSIILPYECNEEPYFYVNLKTKKLTIPFIEISNSSYNTDKFFENYINQNGYTVGSKVEVGRNSNMISYLSDGWASPEEWGVWSNGKEAGIELIMNKFNKEKDFTFRGVFSGYVIKEPQVIQVYINDAFAEDWEFISLNSGEEKSVTIPKEMLKDNNTLNIRFKISNPISPASLGKSNDNRELGISMQWFIVEQ
ncbi:hypothetical protein GKZ28_04045 [Clostridium chromiireducens]|uniref:Uncharacterized protein n=1 Tax=Clostridium chromiireducens TaxID=225345 RepID=A0A964W127_9CLOT|nr:hypothetical protein [Clostridium chromiireducens]MVX62874.1 hypothetical protein [Clostridium chromiireducens]